MCENVVCLGVVFYGIVENNWLFIFIVFVQ